MSKKDKNKKNPVQAAKPVINKSEAAPEVKQPEKPIEAAIPEVVETPEVVDATPVVETPKEEKKPEAKKSEDKKPQKEQQKKAPVTIEKFKPQDLSILQQNPVLNPEVSVRMMELIQKEYLTDKENPLYSTYKPQFDYMMAFQCALYNQSFQEAGKLFGIKVDERAIDAITANFADYGIIVPKKALAPAGDGQTIINFKDVEVTKEAEVGIRRDIMAAQAEVIPELDPTKITDVDGISAAIIYLMTRTNLKTGDNIINAIEKMREIRKCQSEEKDKAKWDTILPGELLTEMLNVIEVPASILNGLMNAVYNTAKMDKTAITTHCIVHKHFPNLGDDEIASIVRAILEYKAKGATDQDPAIVGIVSDTRERLDEFYNRTEDLGKKVMGMLTNNYGESFDKKENREVLAKNVMISLANLYRDKDAKIALYEEKGYPEKKN